MSGSQSPEIGLSFGVVKSYRERVSVMSQKSGLSFGLIAGALFVSAGAASAGGNDFTFSPIKSEVGIARAATEPIEIRLLDKAGQPVPGASFTRIRLDMAPDGMAMHTAKANLYPTVKPGVYRLEADYSMTGRWQLSVAAKVPGESETVTGKVVLTVAP